MNAKSVRAQLLQMSRETKEDYQRLLTRFAIERVLYRLSISDHAGIFVLKGATLFSVWTGKPHRATKDLDLLGRGEPAPPHWVEVFQQILAVDSIEDGVTFDVDGIRAQPIRAETHYTGTRLTVPTHIGKARLKIQIDIGLGDATVPTPTEIRVPPLLDLPAASLRAYAPETVVAEKLEALIVLGLHTSRMKDLYDLIHIKHHFTLEDTLVPAIRATFSRRGTPLPTSIPIGLSDVFASDSLKQKQWKAFLRKATDGETLSLASVITELRDWLWPLLESAAE